jgi:hypothetical protein
LTNKAFVWLVVFQFVVYSFLSVVAFIAWAMAFTQNLSMVKLIVGQYIRGHLVRWTTQFPLWGVFMLISGVLSLVAVWSPWHSRREGAYIGIVSFSTGFITNIIFAQNILVHTLIGALIGWTLLAPLVLLMISEKGKLPSTR